MKTIYRKSEASISRDLTIERYLREIRDFQPFPYETERQLLIEAKQGNKQSRDKLVTANLKFVVLCAKEYQYPGIEIHDLIQAGNEGLFLAIVKYDMQKELKFISYAVWWIKMKIIEHIKEYGKLIHIPYNQQDEIERLTKEKNKLEQEYQGSVPFEYLLNDKFEKKFSKENIKQALFCNTSVASFDEPLSSNGEGEGEHTLQDLVFSKNYDLDEHYKHIHLKQYLSNALNKFTALQQQVVTLAFGLGNKPECSNEGIAEQLGITPERVRQIKKKVLISLKEKNNLAYFL